MPAQPAARLVADVIRIMRGAVSHIAATINLIWHTYASIAATILDLAGTLITVRPASSHPGSDPDSVPSTLTLALISA